MSSAIQASLRDITPGQAAVFYQESVWAGDDRGVAGREWVRSRETSTRTDLTQRRRSKNIPAIALGAVIATLYGALFYSGLASRVLPPAAVPGPGLVRICVRHFRAT
jgi:hypothetical protein